MFVLPHPLLSAQDSKALKFLATVPQDSRLFWVIFSIWISYALGLIAVGYFGDNFDDFLAGIPSWFLLAVSPAAVVLCSLKISRALHSLLDSCSEACENVENLTLRFIVKHAWVGFCGSMKRSTERFQKEPCFYVVRTLWLAQGVAAWWALLFIFGVPVAVDVPPFQFDDSNDQNGLSVTTNLVTLAFAVVVLIIGILLKTCAMCRLKPERSTIIPERRYSSAGTVRSGICGMCPDSPIPSLLVGWGIGYWLTSLLYVLGGSWRGGGWTGAPIAVSVAGYVILPLFIIAGVCVMFDTNLLGERLGAWLEPVVVALRDKSGVLYWVMATVLRDVLLFWVLLYFLLLTFLLTDF